MLVEQGEETGERSKLWDVVKTDRLVKDPEIFVQGEVKRVVEAVAQWYHEGSAFSA